MNLPTRKYSQDLRRYYRLPAVQVSLTIVLSLFVMSIFIVFALRPTIVSIVTLKKTITQSRSVLKQLDTKVTNLQKASTQLDKIKSYLPILNSDIPNNGAMYAPLSSAVEGIASMTGTQLESESLGPTLLYSRLLTPFVPNKAQVVVELPFAVRVVGSYGGVMDFLTKLLSMERIISVESVTMVREVAAKSETAVIGLNINGKAYYLADKAQLDKSLVETKRSK